MKRFLSLQVMLWLFAASVVAQSIRQDTTGSGEIDSRAVWDIRNNTDVWDRLRECGRDGGYLDCISEVMREAGASPQAIAATRLLEGDVFISSFREMGRVDFAEAFNPFMANSNNRFLLVNGMPRILDVGGSLEVSDDVLRRDPLYPSFRRQYPNLAIGGYPAFEEMQPLPTGGQRFVFRFQLVNGCRSCWANGYASIAYDFDETGRFRGTTFLRIIRARADGTPIPDTSAQSRSRSRAQSSIPSYIRPTHRAILERWLASRPELRLTTESDCEDCTRQINEIRQYQQIGYQPYYAIGDFNGDGRQDFAVVLLTNNSRENAAIAVFNAPFTGRNSSPAFFQAGQDLSGSNLFFGPPRPRPYRLLVGPFESDAGFLLIPRGRGYVVN